MFIDSFTAIQSPRVGIAHLQAHAMSRRLANRFGKLAIAGLCLLQMFIANVALADKSVCVHDVAGFNSAINTAKSDNQLTAIKIETGTYQLGALDVTFAAPVVIAGAYVPGTSCTQRVAGPDTTILDFGGAGHDVKLQEGLFSPYALIKLDRITLRNGRSLYIESGEFKHPLYLGQDDFPGHITIVRSHITGFTGGATIDNAAVALNTYNGNITIIDALFDHLSAPGSCAVSIFPEDDNTIYLDHVTMDLGGGRDFCLSDSGDDDDWNYTIDNSIIWASDGTLSAIRGLNDYDNGKNTHVAINNTLFKGYVGAGDSTITHQLSSDPKWINPPARDYHLQLAPKSPAINAGTTQVPGGEPSIDLDGNPRLVGSAPDIGAYESPANDASTFTVTNRNDSGPGSLREAMTQANASSSPVAGILFDIRDNAQQAICPAVIALQSPLPDIMVPMQIEGYSQGGSIANTDPEAFSATLCVVVQPGAAFPTVGTGFRVPAASTGSLTLAGVAMGGFYRDVMLVGGSGHRILGNQFGGLINQDTYQLGGSTNAAIYVNTTTVPANLQIGGDDPINRNVFQDASVHGGGISASAILIGSSVHGAGSSCQIDGNLIGVTDDGAATIGNDYGLMLEGSSCNARGNRFAGNFKDAIWINGGNDNVVQNNSIGVLAYGFNLASVNHGVGVRVEGNDNVIGGSVFDGAPIAHENTIENMDGPGIVVIGGAGNTLRANTLVYNNAAVASDLEIDLGYDGPTVNDSSDADAGANLQQNFPTLHGLAWAVPPKAGDTNVSATISGTLRTQPGPGFYQVDAYSSDSCDPITGRGTGQTYVGGISYVYVPVGSNVAAFSVPVTLPFYSPKGGTVSVTATSNSNGDYSTSELGKCFNTDTIYRDGVEAE